MASDIKASKDNLLKAEDFFTLGKLEKLEIPELEKDGKPGVVHLRDLTAGEVLDFSALSDDERNSAMLDLIVKAVVNPDGSPMFDKDMVEMLPNISASAFSRISSAISSKISVASGREGNE